LFLTFLLEQDPFVCLEAWSLLQRQSCIVPVFYSIHPQECRINRYGELGNALSEVASKPQGYGEIVNPGLQMPPGQFLCEELVPRLLNGVVRDTENQLPTLPTEQMYDLLKHIQTKVMPQIRASPQSLPAVARALRDDLHRRGPDAVLYGAVSEEIGPAVPGTFKHVLLLSIITCFSLPLLPNTHVLLSRSFPYFNRHAASPLAHPAAQSALRCARRRAGCFARALASDGDGCGDGPAGHRKDVNGERVRAPIQARLRVDSVDQCRHAQSGT
jgi:hypothetical protein